MQLLSFYAYSFIPFFGRKVRQINDISPGKLPSGESTFGRNDRLSPLVVFFIALRGFSLGAIVVVFFFHFSLRC